MLIQIEKLSYVYSPGTPLARTALDGVSLELRPGERVGLVGQTGSGKSTLAQQIAGLLAPTAGRVLLDGVPAHERTPAARAQRRRVGLAFQHPEQQIFEQTVFKEVAFGPHNLGLTEAEAVERVQWALEMTGLDPAAFVERAPFGLSGGEMRRVALAGILAMRPDVLILDEPTAGLDPRGRRELLARVDGWQAHTGMTLVLISHHLDEVARLVDRVILLAGGQVAADGPTRQVLGDSQLLCSAGLSAPQPVALLETLRAAGWQVHTDLLLPEQVAAEIGQAWRQRSGS
ncbi:MAG: energy-coupling factor transporter ATPase [Anaerolineae bacterium]|nr:energy-coupling factor transporter ATPase [Anaerolineae bacterium]